MKAFAAALVVWLSFSGGSKDVALVDSVDDGTDMEGVSALFVVPCCLSFP